MGYSAIQVKSSVALTATPLMACLIATITSVLFMTACPGAEDSHRPGADAGSDSSPTNCDNDEQCGPGQCCRTAGQYCAPRVPIDPGESTCSMWGADGYFVCFCIPPSAETSLCPNFPVQPQVSESCSPQPYLRCALLCDSGLCVCETEGPKFLGDGGATVASCPPPDWTACNADSGGAD